MAASSEKLSESQNLKLVQFQEITGFEDLLRCKDILCAHSWDLEAAVSTALHLPSSPTSNRQRAQDMPSVDQNFRSADYTLSYWRPRGWITFGWYVMQWPLSFFVRTIYNIVRLAISLIRNDSRLAVTDSDGNVRQFIKEFTDRYGSVVPTFLETSYNQALSRAKAELRFLLVYLHNASHEDTDHFCRGVLCTPQVVNWLEENMLVWGCSVQLPEGHKVSRTLRERTYPFVCVVVLRESRMTLVARIQGQIESADQLIGILATIKADNEASLRAAQIERMSKTKSVTSRSGSTDLHDLDIDDSVFELIVPRNERSVNQTLRQQQDEAYFQSLRVDQEKARKRREDEQRKREAEEEAARKAAEAARAFELREREKLELAMKVPAEPGKDDHGVIQLALRLPSGKRIDRRFLQTHSMKYLYYYVLCHSDAPDNFEIHTSYPRRKIPCQPAPGSDEDPPSFIEFGIARNESLMVSDLDA
ncbi:FAS-associated factor 2-B-like [Tropilaelaps mercedesae]|uniref:FAS-associated factor 2-B-like n=1 Tax=Tropilaelaps mercedesae TaxID=418985 RepID=A0A1V9Y1N6_9ACAR|nr:FAS-associated factor 2-B-like [Tropilaelaps mercedesae]